MTDVRKRPEAERPSEVERRVPVVERPERRPPVRPEPSRFVRWMGWLMGIVLVAGIAGLVWWGLSTPEEVLVAPPIEQIDPHESPEIMRIPQVAAPSAEAFSFDVQTRILLEANDAIGD